MHGLRELLLPLAVLTDANERDRGLIATLELAALSGQPVMLPPKSGRVSLRVRQAAIQASERAQFYQQCRAERPTILDQEALESELEWPLWETLPKPGDSFEDAGQHYRCLDILRESDPDDSGGHSLLLVLAVPNEEPDLR
ncbi:hypothetical protein [Deinococcus alpinitundrae]|uniref:hypothetical protein n=1 Tax=Deinococcus alpinitundrae TaxID=468913 RepID=UPI00137B55ED|nr:hypothetical protein [Deinococcus alpinitundrae]